MDMLRQWLISLVFAAMAGTLISVVSPKGSGEKALKTVIGIFIIAAICSPLTELESSDFSLPVFAQNDSAYIDEDMNDYLAHALEKEVGSRLSDCAEQLNIEIEDVVIKAETDDNGCIIIHEVLIKIQNYEYESAQKAVGVLSEELGMPVTLTE